MVPLRRHALLEPVPDVTLEESHEEVPPQGGAILVDGFDQFTNVL